MPYADAVQGGQSPLFVTKIDLHGATYYIVKRADGSLGRLQHSYPLGAAIVQGIPENSRKYLQDWIEQVEPRGNFSVGVLDFKRKLLNDARMRGFWEWFERLEHKSVRYLLSSLSITESLWRATKLPGKPGNMTPKQREAYFESVKKHTYALAELLQDTIFDGGHERLVTDEELYKPLDEALRKWGDDESDDGHIVAFRVTPYEKYNLSYDYPRCALVESLLELIEWTYWNDQWDSRFWGSSSPIVQSNSRSTPIVYFTCSVFDSLSRDGIEIPFPILATVTNVALDLSVEDMVDEDTVRRQVRRHQARVSVRDKAWSGASLEGGQNLTELDDSVLFPPF